VAERHGERPGDVARRASGVNRRTFIAGASAVGGAVVVDAAVSQAKVGSHAIKSIRPAISLIQGRGVPAVTVYVRRRNDFLFLQIIGYHVRIHGQALVATGTGTPTIVVTHLPQHLAEEAFLDPGQTPKSPGHSKAALAYASRLAFTFPAGVTQIPLKTPALLDWSKLDANLTPTAAYVPFHIAQDSPGSKIKRRPRKAIHPAPPLAAPKATETAIELPWRLAISPTLDGSWSHPTDVVERGGWTELWHTRLAASTDLNAPDGGAIRAVWNYDKLSSGKPTLSKNSLPPDNSPFLSALSVPDRYQIVRATGDFSVGGRADIPASKLWLSARGGFLDSDGHWNLSNTSGLTLTEWKHLATIGRDHYVKVVYKGFLFPFGHRAVLTKITERKFEAVGSEIVATSRQIHYLTVKQPIKNYADSSQTFGLANDGRDFPFRVIEIKTLRTPNLSPPFGGYGGVSDAFVPYVGTGSAYAPFLFHLVGTDWDGNLAPFVATAVFVPSNDAFDPTKSGKVRTAYNKPQTPDIRLGQFTGTQVVMAESKTAGDTSLEVHTITFGANPGIGHHVSGVWTPAVTKYENADQPICYPYLQQAQVRLSAAEQAAGGASLGTPTVNYNDTFVSHSFNSAQNVGNLFMEIAGGPNLNFSGGSAGGVMTPNLSLTGISRALGPVAGDLSNILGGTFDPESVFKNVEAKILGGVNLIDLIAKVLLTGGVGARDVGHGDPNTLYDDGALKITYDTSGTTLTTEVDWTPPLKDNPIISAFTDTGGTNSFTLDGTITTDLTNPKSSSFKVMGDLEYFTVSLMDNTGGGEQFINVNFNKLTFNAQNGQKSKVKVDIDSVNFLGVLKFVEQLEELMDFTGDGGPKINVTPTEINAEIGVSLPDLGVGIFSISNITVDASFNLPFNGDPARIRFSISTRDDPFTLSVAIFGGSGFFGIAVGTDGVELIEASFDFGAMASIDLGVASGSVQLVAGVYFAYGQIQPPSTATGCILTGFVKLDGHLSILGIITLSLEFDLTLTYEEISGKSEVTGTATLTVSISILFFSASVSMTATKTFGNGSTGMAIPPPHSSRRRIGLAPGAPGGPPTFEQQMPPDAPGGTTSTLWNTYCAAFASTTT
jgi:hypothetical protein